MARVEVKELLPISQAKPGMIAFKKREPGEEGYNLPDDYLLGGSHYNGDLADYHHVGLVMKILPTCLMRKAQRQDLFAVRSPRVGMLWVMESK